MPKRPFAWTPLRQRFCQEYPLDFNASAAYKRAGGGPKAAPVEASRLMATPEIQERIASHVQRAVERAEAKAGLSVDRILEELQALALSDVGELFDLTQDRLLMLPMKDWPPLARKAISSIKAKGYTDQAGRPFEILEIKLWDKNAALEKAGKHFKMFVDILEHRGRILFAEVTRKDTPAEWLNRFRGDHPRPTGGDHRGNGNGA